MTDIHLPQGISLVLGGARSGKSRFAETLVLKSGLKPVYVATGRALDEEMSERISIHRDRRGKTWETVEEPLALADTLLQIAHPGRAVLVDCLTLWVTNLMMAGANINIECDGLIAALGEINVPVVLVSSEVGLGIVPESKMGREFRDHAGMVNQRVAIASRTCLVHRCRSAAGLEKQHLKHLTETVRPLPVQSAPLENSTMANADIAKIPATVITGFLGAGKTTLIRNLLQTANGKRIALIINEFGDLGVDGDVLKGCGVETCTEDDIVELTNGCICCTVADDFIPTMKALLDRENRPDHIVIETSGLALPQPLVNAFNWPEIRERVTVDGVVTVVDSHAVANGQFAHDTDKVNAQRAADKALDHESPLEELFEDQINCADMIILNKSDLVDEATLTRVQDDIEKEINRSVKVVRAANGSLPASVLLGLGSATESEVHNRKSHHEREHDAFHAEHGDGGGTSS